MVEQAKVKNIEGNQEELGKIYLLSPEKEVVSSSSVKSVCLVARHPGAGKYLIPVAEHFVSQGITVTFIASGDSENYILSHFSSQLSPQISVPTVDWAVVCSDHPVNFELVNLFRLKKQNPKLKIAITEDGPGTVHDLLASTVESTRITPDLVLPSLIQSAAQYNQEFESALKDTPVIPIGQAGYDRLRNFPELRQEAATKLPELVDGYENIVFIGVPEVDYPALGIKVKHGNKKNDLNTLALGMSLNALIEIAAQQPGRKIRVIYAPHPRANQNIEEHIQYQQEPSFFKKARNLMNKRKIKNLELLYINKEELDQRGISNTHLALLSRVMLSTLSGMPQEWALANSMHVLPDLARIVIIKPEEYYRRYDVNFKKHQLQGKNSATYRHTLELLMKGPDLLEGYQTALFISDATETKDVLLKALASGNDEGQINQELGKVLRQQYRTEEPTAPRVLAWMEAVDRLAQQPIKP